MPTPAENVVSRQYLWHPGDGPDAAALARMCKAFRVPERPVGEAWFMGDPRRTFPELMDDLHLLSIEELQRPLEEIASGPSSFGERTEWTDWYHYLLPRLIPRGHETWAMRALLEILVTGFMTQHPDGLDIEPYRGFRQDALETLGRCLMDAACWPGGHLDAEFCLNKFYIERVGVTYWCDASSKLSSSMFFCLKYLKAHEVSPWLASVLAIASPQWRGQLIAWFVGAYGLLTGRITQPTEFAEDGSPAINWNWSHCLTGRYSGDLSDDAARSCFLPEANRAAALQALRTKVMEDVLLDWIASISAVPDLESELADLPYQFNRLYLSEPT